MRGVTVEDYRTARFRAYNAGWQTHTGIMEAALVLRNAQVRLIRARYSTMMSAADWEAHDMLRRLYWQLVRELQALEVPEGADR